MKFKLGRLVATSGITEAMLQSDQFSKEVNQCIYSHLTGDYGTVSLDDHDTKMNEDSIINGQVKKFKRVLSRYKLSKGNIYIITERVHDTVTTVLFTSEY